MYLYTILLLLMCVQLISATSSDSYDVNSNDQVDLARPKLAFDNDDSDDDYKFSRRTAAFLRFGRQMPSTSGSFLRFGRNGHSGGAFLRFGRSIVPYQRLIRSGSNSGAFLRFGRQSQLSSGSQFHSARKGDFLRFG